MATLVDYYPSGTTGSMFSGDATFSHIAGARPLIVRTTVGKALQFQGVQGIIERVFSGAQSGLITADVVLSLDAKVAGTSEFVQWRNGAARGGALGLTADANGDTQVRLFRLSGTSGVSAFTSTITGGVPTNGTRFRVQLANEGSNLTMRVFSNDTTTTAASTFTAATSDAINPSALRAGIITAAGIGSANLTIHAVRVQTVTTPGVPSYPAQSAEPPRVIATTPPAVEPWTTGVPLSATVIQETNPIASVVWTGPAGVLEAGSGANRTFTAPPSLTGAAVPFTVTVTDTQGLTGTASVNAPVYRATRGRKVGGQWVPTRRVAAVVTPETPGPLTVAHGVNAAGAEFDGAAGTYDSDASFAYYAARGHKRIRLPFKWSRVQPTLLGALDTTHLNRMKAAVTSVTSRGMYAVLDCHNYFRFNGTLVTSAQMANLWTRLAAEFKDNPLVEFGLMNEPNQLGGTDQQQADLWEIAAQDSVTAIRGAGAQNFIWVAGIQWSSADAYSTHHPTWWIVDPAGRHRSGPEGHIYFDYLNNQQGTYPNTYAADNARAVQDGVSSITEKALLQLANFTDYCAAQNVSGLIGEVGWPNSTSAAAYPADSASWNALGNQIYQAATNAGVSITFWSAGEQWGTGYNQSAYLGTPQATPTSIATVIEAYNGTPTTPAKPILGMGVLQAETDAQIDQVRAAGANLVYVAARWSDMQTTAGGALNFTTVNSRIDYAISKGMKVILRPGVQYTPSWAQTEIPLYVDQNGATWASANSGERIRDWVWSAIGKQRVEAFYTALIQGLTPARKAAIVSVQTGFGIYGETQMPRVNLVSGIANLKWWGFSAPAQTGVGLASDQVVCPFPGHKPFDGVPAGTEGSATDLAWVNWYRNSVRVRANSLVTALRTGGWTGNVQVLHPSFGVRNTWDSGDFGWREQNAQGCDWRHQISGYPDANVYPWCTDVGKADQAWANTSEDGESAGRFLAKVAGENGRTAHLGGENTGGGTTDNQTQFYVDLERYGYKYGLYAFYSTLTDGTGDSLARFAELNAQYVEP